MNPKELEQWIKEVDKKLDNHLVHVVADIAQMRTDLEWIKRTYWTVVGISASALLAVLTILFK